MKVMSHFLKNWPREEEKENLKVKEKQTENPINSYMRRHTKFNFLGPHLDNLLHFLHSVTIINTYFETFKPFDVREK